MEEVIKQNLDGSTELKQKKRSRIKDFHSLQLKVASPDDILSWSHGEVKKAETINYRTHRAEPDGLMCERIFGPTKDYECYCGKYKKYKHKGIICDKCGVEVTRKAVRRERMGHIKLASPVAHIWYSNGIGSKISILLDIPSKKLQSVIYFSRYLVVEFDEDQKSEAINIVKEKMSEAVEESKSGIEKKIENEEMELDKQVKDLKSGADSEDQELEIENLSHKTRLKIAKLKEEILKEKNRIESEFNYVINLIQRVNVGETLSEEERYLLLEKDVPTFFTLMMGAEAIKYLLENVDLEKTLEKLREDSKSPNLQKRLKSIQRLRIINSFHQNEMNPEWLILEVLPVIPPDLRPIVQISGGRFATADLNDLYRRVINRNNRLKRLIELGAPDVILRNEKRMLQESVDALIDNEHKGNAAVVNKRKVPLKSLSASLRGKQGRFRQNLLGKRVDYSGRAVIVTAGRDLKLNQCGVPKEMALELFKPFVIHQLIDRGYAVNARSAKLMIEGREKVDEVWNVLEEVIEGHPVLLNRAPTLHKHGIQAFFPILVDGSALRIHPLVCDGYNADFDGDQMAIHVPLTIEAVQEAIDVMMPDKILLNNSSGEFIMAPFRDHIQACYYLTTIREDIRKEKLPVFESFSMAEKAFQNGLIHIKEPIELAKDGEKVETTVGRIIFNQLLPEGYEYYNDVINKKKLKSITLDIFAKYPRESVVDTLNKINDIGFKYSTYSGFSTGLDDLVSIKDLDKKIADALTKTKEINDYYQMGFLTERDKSSQFIKLWMDEFVPEIEQLTKEFLPDDNSLKAVAESGARYGYDVINQVVGIKGVVQDASLRTIELPITSNYTSGFTAFEYFVAAKGGRKGVIDTALRTADSGYLTRKLCEVSQDCLVREHDCGQSSKGLTVTRADDDIRTKPFADRLVGRTPLKDIKDKKGNVIVQAGEYITKEISAKIEEAKLDNIEIRTPLTCKSKFGVCQKCYGYDYGTGEPVNIGKAVGIIAAQSIGEPATQLVLRTFHAGGVAGDDITSGMPRVQELFEARIPKGKAIISEIPGVVSIIENQKENVVRVVNKTTELFDYPYSKEDKVVVKTKQKKVKAGDLLIVTKNDLEVRSKVSGNLTIKENVILIESSGTEEVEYKVPKDQELMIAEGDEIESGTQITRGNIDPRQLLQAKGLLNVQKYIIDEIQKVYQVQGIGIGDKHLEIITSQMGRYVKVINSGDSGIVIGETKDKYIIDAINEKLKNEGKKEIKYAQTLLGITLATLKTESFLSAASFQEQVRVLSDAAIMGKKDYLRGLKENIIIGRMIPTGDKAMIESLEI